MMIAEIATLTKDPVWPWSVPAFGLPALGLVAGLLVVLTLWTYLDGRRASRGRVATVIALRLAALVLACLVLLRPSLAFHGDNRVPSTLLLIPDTSGSMTTQDEFDGQSRWDRLCRLLRECEPLLRGLQDREKVTVITYGFAGDLHDFDPNGKADGLRTDFGVMLHSLYERHGRERNLRGVLVFSDGADNGSRYLPLAEAAKWRSLPCPIHTFGFGKPTTTESRNDIAFTDIRCEPSPVRIKNKLTVKGTLDAHGFENAPVTVHLFFDDKEVLARKEVLAKAEQNEIRLTADAPATPGEIKVTLKVDPLPGEVSKANNEISTFATVSKEGVSVLLVDRPRVWEPQRICDALASDPRIRVYTAWRRSDQPDPGQADLFQFARQHYDVIILGDVSARRLAPDNPRALTQIHDLVRKGSGLLMMGGYDSFGNSDWGGTDIEKLLPVQLDASGQVEGSLKVVPTAEGFAHFVLRLADNETDSKNLWGKLPPLTGMTKLGATKPGAFVLARAQSGEPVLVGQQYGDGRTLAFAGDTTWRWERLGQPKSGTGIEAHHRFWRQVVLWLARQDQAAGSVWVKPRARRLRPGDLFGFSVGIQGKGGVDLKNGKFEVEVEGPDKVKTPVPTAREKDDEEGSFWKTDVPGEYRVTVRGRAKDSDGTEVKGEASARFLVHQDDAELLRRAADPDFLRRLANAGGGKFHRPEELAGFLRELAKQPVGLARPRAEHWPDWRQSNRPGFPGVLLFLFAGVLCTEWFLRRCWGMV